MTTAHPKRLQCCAFCKSWDGDANLVVVTKDTGFRFNESARGTCIKTRNSKRATEKCRDFAISVEADRIM